MGRVISTGSAGKDRLLFEKGIVLAIHELASQQSMNDITYDLVAYIALSLKAISDTIENSVSAWEKRGYWLKADRYRMEWNWTIKLSGDLRAALIEENWMSVAQITAQITQKMSKVKLPQRNNLGKPWVGSWSKLKNEKIGKIDAH